MAVYIRAFRVQKASESIFEVSYIIKNQMNSDTYLVDQLKPITNSKFIGNLYLTSKKE